MGWGEGGEQLINRYLFSVIFTKGYNFWHFLFASLDNEPLLKGGLFLKDVRMFLYIHTYSRTSMARTPLGL